MFDAVGHSVVKLRRVQIGSVDDANLPVGKWRPLADAEVKRLMSSAAGVRAAKPERLGKPGGPTRRKEGPRARSGGPGPARRNRGRV
jgi:23S rRNA pseudouridine2605 synthase